MSTKSRGMRMRCFTDVRRTTGMRSAYFAPSGSPSTGSYAACRSFASASRSTVASTEPIATMTSPSLRKSPDANAIR